MATSDRLCLLMISAPKHLLKRENKEQNTGCRLDPRARVQRRKRSPRPARLRRGKGEGRRHRTRPGCGGGTELSWGTWHTSPFAWGILCPHVWASAVTAHPSPTPPPISSIRPQLHPAARQAVVLCRGMPRPC